MSGGVAARCTGGVRETETASGFTVAPVSGYVAPKMEEAGPRQTVMVVVVYVLRHKDYEVQAENDELHEDRGHVPGGGRG